MNNNLTVDLENLEVKNKAIWVASLSNGEIVFEGRGNFQEIKDEPSPWQKLIKYTIANKLSIQSLRIKQGKSYFNLPTRTNKPKFKTEKPIDYNYFRKLEGDIGTGDINKRTIFRYICIEAIYSDSKVQLWVDENGDCNSWITLIKNS